MQIFYKQGGDDGARAFVVVYSAGGNVFRGEGAAVGQDAEWVGAPPREGVSTAQVEEALRLRAEQDGYRPAGDDEVHTLMIQFALDGWGSDADLSRRHEAERAVSQVLLGQGFGTVDGGDIGSGKMTIWTYVIEPARAAAACVAALQAADLLGEAVLVSAPPDDDDTHIAHWPEGYDVSRFSVL